MATEYILSGEETLTDTPYVLNNPGILHIGAEGAGEGILNIKYSTSTGSMFSGNGTINVGTEQIAGTLNITGTNASFPEMTYKNIFNFGSGTINVASKGVVNMNGYTPSSWANVYTVGTLNLYGTFKFNSTNACSSYLQLVNFNLYEGATFSSTQDLRTSNGTWNIYKDSISNVSIRVGAWSGSSNDTINLYAADALKSCKSINYDTDNVTLSLTANNAKQTIGGINFVKNCTLNLTLAETKGSDLFIINNLGTKNYAKDYTGIVMNIENFANDYICIRNTNGIGISDDNRIYLANLNTYITINGYEGSKSEGAIVGNWYLESNGDGYYFLNNTGVVPEPATSAVLFALATVAFAVWRRRK